jgi:cytochrome c biogenesis protein CcdA
VSRQDRFEESQVPKRSTPEPQRNDLAVRSLAAGILTWFCVPVVFAIVAIYLGRKAQDAAERGEADNAHLANVGIVLGWIHLAVMGLLLLVRFVVYLVGMSGGFT